MTVSERSKLITKWACTQAYTRLFTTRYLALAEKNIAKTVFDRVPKFCCNTISRFYSAMYPTDMS